MAELVDALVSGTSDESRGGSSPLQGTKFSTSTFLSNFRFTVFRTLIVTDRCFFNARGGYAMLDVVIPAGATQQILRRKSICMTI